MMNNWQPLYFFYNDYRRCANFTGGERNANI